jgi:DNA polymerase III subunit gamma/tau
VAPEPTAPTEPGALDATALRGLWSEVLEIVGKASKTTWAMLDGAQITSVAGDLVTLAVSPSLARRVAEDRNTSLLSKAFTEVVGGTWRIAIEPARSKADSPASAAPTNAAAPAARAVEQDPRDDTDLDAPAGRSSAPDPETVALRLLQDQLGARPLEDG